MHSRWIAGYVEEKDMSQMHTGHRARLRKRFCKEGLQNFEPHEVLELLLTYAITRKDTNPLAHTLLDYFGSMDAVLEAPVEELMKVPGMGEQSAVLLNLIPSLTAYYLNEKNTCSHRILDSTEKIGHYLIPLFVGKTEEVTYLLSLNNRNQLLGCDLVSKGSITYVPMYFRKISEILLRRQATAAVVAHNHPSGFALPSGKDAETTKMLFVFLQQMEVRLIDHIIVADHDFVSLRDSGVLL